MRSAVEEDHKIMVLCVEETTMQAHRAHDLLCSLLEVICRKHIRWIRKPAGRCIEIEPSSIE